MRSALAALLLAAWGFAALAPPGALAVQTNAGVGGAQFLRLGAGARALAMGEAYGPVAEGPEAIYWNPAGLAQLKEPAFSYTHSELLQFFHYDFTAYAQPVAALKGTLAASYTRLSQNNMPLVTKSNVEVGSFAPHSDAVALAYAGAFALTGTVARDRDYFKDTWNLPMADRPLAEEGELWAGNLMLGLSLKALDETYYDRSASAFAVDGGALFRPEGRSELALSFSFRNAGTPERFIHDAQKLPAEAGFGAAYGLRWGEARLLPAFELALPYYGSPYAKFGVEFSKTVAENTSVALRAGYTSEPAIDLSPLTGLTTGVGVTYKRFSTDFGFEPMAALGEVYRLSLGLSW